MTPIRPHHARLARVLLVLGLFGLNACSGGGGSGGGSAKASAADSCMTCHNASPKNDYAGPGLPDPHPFPGASNMRCTKCHGGNGKGEDQFDSHVPPPPEIGDEANLIANRNAYFNRLTLTGIDKFPDYEVDGKTYSALDYLQFINPGDLRVVADGRSCGECHMPHVNDVSRSLLATEAGILSGAKYGIGAANEIVAQQGLYEDTAADMGFRAQVDVNYNADPSDTGAVQQLIEYPVYSVKGSDGPQDMDDNDLYLSAGLVNDVQVDGRVVSGSPLANLYHEQIAFTCGDCHLGSAGANNRTGDYRSSGCTACHMPYSLGGRYTGPDPNINKLEPLDPDDIEEPERPHVRAHRIVSVARTLSNGVQQQGIDDYSCAGCHQGSNRTVMQYWGIRLDQNEDLRRGVQYPAMPAGGFVDTRNDERLFDPVLGNKEFNGRDGRQYILFEDYDNDGRDDTPPDVHYEAGMGCIDCHGSFDLHGGDYTKPGSDIYSRMEHGTAISCESCHGTSEAYATTVPAQNYAGQTVELAVDGQGIPLKHLERRPNGEYWMTSRLTGAEHYVPQTRDTVVDSGVVNPQTNEPVYTAFASFAMGRADGDPSTGIGPRQLDMPDTGFRHADNMDCASCHSSWTNTCAGCHLEGEYNENNNFSNITGQNIVFRERNADFVYQSPIPFSLGVDPDGRITQMSANTKMFFKYRDRQGQFSDVFTFSDRNGQGANELTSAFPSLSHNAMMAHSIRGKVDDLNEGPRYCNACHLTDEGLATYGEAEYDAFVADMAAGNFGALDFPELQTHIGLNPGNQLDSPLFVHMAAGLGTGLFLFDENGTPLNDLDLDPNRAGVIDNQAPASVAFDPFAVVYNLDRIVEASGKSNGSNNHALIDPAVGSGLRDGADNPRMSGPLGGTIIQRLTDRTNGIVLDAWIDPDGQPRGNANTVIGGGP